ncbi:MAG: DUF4397 domain-containing protein [Myxococcota bacterium]
MNRGTVSLGLASALLVAALPACAPEPCSVTQDPTTEAVRIECPDGTNAQIPDGPRGEPGARGAQGIAGGVGPSGPPGVIGPEGAAADPCTVLVDETTGNATLTCPDGTTTDIDAATSCTATQNPDRTVTLSCPDGSEAIIGTPVPAYVQIIHASADPGAATVDVWVNGALLLDDFAFKQGTNFFEVPPGTDLEVTVTAPDANNAQDMIVPNGRATLNVPAGASWAVVATGTPDATAAQAEQFELIAIQGAKREGRDVNTVSLLPVHGIVDAPTVDVSLDNGSAGTVPSLEFTDFSQGEPGVASYLDVVSDDTAFADRSLVDLFASADGSLLGNYQLGGLRDVRGQAFIVVATGRVANNFGLTAYPSSSGATPVVTAGIDLPQSARLQIVHNAADPSAATVDVWVDNKRSLDDFAFRTASPFVSAPSDTAIPVDIQPGGAQLNRDPLFSKTFGPLPAGATAAIIANGVLDPAGFEATANSAQDIAFDLFAVPTREAARSATDIDLVLFHGATDVSAVGVRVKESMTVLNPSFGYGTDTGLIAVADPMAPVTLELLDAADGSALFESTAPVDFSAAVGEGALVLASGFLDPANNGNPPGRALAGLLVLSDGTTQVVALRAP